MFEDRAAAFDVDLPDCVDATALAILHPEPAAPRHVQPESADLKMPRWIWRTMLGCYGVFFTGLLLATGHDRGALFMIAISVAYAVMYFGTARILVRQNPAVTPSPFARGIGPLLTWTGPMDTTTVAAQVLTVPACFALFGVALVAIRAFAF
ncbi:hypothetical protein [Sphingomonas sp. SUN039]|uniref:hypothetical protein n=1 Tax=Sphingomonas sp. SUN039 TaxID=2937787 RepID=UPI0021640421|nr:hypothetical protein [Sphingomonas sp. SUN039]UVO52894.1 hypothetical protein M0209_01685 [Sphingomonas sp. SUN039]